LIHDYYNTFFPGIKKVVDEWVKENQEYRALPIGDNMSVMIIGY
jgi:hypothetical protein